MSKSFTHFFSRKLIAIILSTAFLLSVCTSCALKQADSRKDGKGVYHIVQRGQTLYRIGLTYGVSVAELARANRISDPNVISVGDTLFIPGADAVLHVEPYYAYKGTQPYMPVNGTVTSPFGAQRRGYRHTGIDIAAPAGTPIRAVLDGIVTFSGRQNRYGNIVIIEHAGGYSSVYAHNQRNLVRKGQRVHRGDTIATVGSTGNSTGNHLHFELHKDDRVINPVAFLESAR